MQFVQKKMCDLKWYTKAKKMAFAWVTQANQKLNE